MNYSDSDFLPFNLRMEDGKILPQKYSVEYDWLGPDPTRNTLGRYILILPALFITSTHMVLNDQS